MNRFKEMLPYLIVIIISFYILPILIKDTGSGIMMLILIIPLICFINAFIYGLRKGFNLIFNIVIAALFVPTIFIYYNSSALVYTIGYGVISLIGNLIGSDCYN